VLLAQQYPTLGKKGLSEREIRRVLTSRGYSGRIGANSNRVTEILFAAEGDLKAAENLIKGYYTFKTDENGMPIRDQDGNPVPEATNAFMRADGTVPTLERLREQLRWERTIKDASNALRRRQILSNATDPNRVVENVDRQLAEQAISSAQSAVAPMPREWRLATQVVGKYPYTILCGPPGTGKTALAITELRKKCERVINLYITPETTAAEIMGFTAPNESGAFIWRDGPLTVAMRKGWPCVINEIDDVGGDAETALLGCLDDQDIAQYELMSGETVRPANGFAVVATMNGDPQGLRPALLDRFPLRLKITTPHPGAIAKLPADLREIARKSVSTEDPDQRHSLRTWFAFATCRDEWGMNEEDTALLVFQERARDMLNTIKMARRR
jgi:hypothetical protein